VELRKREDVITDGDYQEILPEREDLFCYRRSDDKTTLTVIANFTANTVDFPAEILLDAGEPELGNYSDWPKDGILRPYEAVMYLRK
jgi:glycosidase